MISVSTSLVYICLLESTKMAKMWNFELSWKFSEIRISASLFKY